jgi:DNA polymerase-3 subunit gamma/tau
LTDLFLAGDYKQTFLVLNRILEAGFDLHQFITSLATHFRDLLVSKDPETIELLEVGDEIGERYRKTSASCPVSFLYEGLKILNTCDLSFKQTKDPRLLVELTLLGLAKIQEKTAERITKPVETVAPKPAQTPVFTSVGPVTRISDFIRKKAEVETQTQPQPESKPSKTDEPHEGPIVLNEKSLRVIWIEFAETLQAEQPRLYNTLITQLPELTPDKKVLLKLNNPLQEKAIRSIQTELNTYLKTRTGDNDILIQTEVPDQPVARKLYTQQEKFNHLQQKNPDLDLFRQSLDLDLE